MKRTRILLADDHPLILEGFRAVLEGEFEVAGLVRNGMELVEAAIRLRPDLVLLDITMPLLNGIDAARQIRKALPKTRLIFVTMHTNPAYLEEAIAVGASGFVLKTSAREQLAEAVRAVAGGGTYMSAGLSTDRAACPSPDGQTRRQPRLTFRQREILQMVADGHTTKEMASALHVTVQTIAFHKHRITHKLGLRTTADLTRYAVREGLVQI